MSINEPICAIEIQLILSGEPTQDPEGKENELHSILCNFPKHRC